MLPGGYRLEAHRQKLRAASAITVLRLSGFSGMPGFL